MTGAELAAVCFDVYERIAQLRVELEAQGIKCDIEMHAHLTLPSGATVTLAGPAP